MTKQTKKLTPLMAQYFAIREQYPDMLLLFQVGDFYELFFDDAQKASSYLGIALTKRGTMDGKPIPLCGVPLHALQHYLVKLVRGGFKVAICDQLTEAVQGKVVERGVTKVLTPGTLTDTQLLDEKSASYLCSFFPAHDAWGLLFTEILTSQVFATTIRAENYKTLEAEISRFMPDEIIVPDGDAGRTFARYFKKMGYFTSLHHASELQQDGKKWVHDQLPKDAVHSHDRMALTSAMSALYAYLKKNNSVAVEHLHKVQWYQADDFLILDAATQRNLELIKNTYDGTKKGTLFTVLDQAATPMGSRTIKKWITRPLTNYAHIQFRHDVIGLFVNNHDLAKQLGPCLKKVGDIERVVGRIVLRQAQISDFLSLKHALHVLPLMMQLLRAHNNDALDLITSHVVDFASLHQLLHASLNDDAHKDWLIKKKFDQELDRLRDMVEHSNEKILAFEAEQKESTGINSLKVKFNNVQGYYIEVTKTNIHLVPEYYVRQQSLVGRERYTTLALQKLQVEIQQAEHTIKKYESDIFSNIVLEVRSHIYPLRRLAQALAQLDALFGLAQAAQLYDFVQPTFNTDRVIAIEKGRHPVVQASSVRNFVPNDTSLNDAQSLWIITGPNMGGKSTYLRQVAHICIMAQMGSFVPAKQADLPLLDRIFTRIGSGDHLVEGKSTFLVEMEETATICTQATDRSLVILDEVGRGTSTYDGLAIAQAVIEYIFKHVRARCLFATHYHELTQLHQRFPAITSYYTASTKTERGIRFLYTIKKGVADGSFGVEVAKLAQLPQEVIVRSQDILLDLKQKEQPRELSGNSDNALPVLQKKYDQLADRYMELERMVSQQKKLQKLLASISFDELSPKKAFDMLWELQSSEQV